MRVIILHLFLLGLISTIVGQEVQNTEQLYTVAESMTGEKQSPINIPGFIVNSKNLNVERDYLSSKISVSYISNIIQCNYDFGSSVIFNDQLYDLKHIQFKTPAEHLISSVTYPLEMQIVHLLRNSNDNSNNFLIISFLFQEGRENEILKNITDNIPDEGEVSSDDENTLYLDELFTGKNNYYFYEGSLTSTPFSETVNWFVIAEIQEASYAQIKRMNVLQKNNARHIQALNGREIIVNSGL